MLCKIFISTLIDLWILYIMNWSELIIDTIHLSLPFQYSYMKVLVKKNQCSLPWARHIICTINPKLNSHLVYRSLFVYMFIFHLLGFNFFLPPVLSAIPSSSSPITKSLNAPIFTETFLELSVHLFQVSVMVL